MSHMKKFFFFLELPVYLRNLGSVWYMCLKTENCYLKTFMEIHVGEKVCENT